MDATVLVDLAVIVLTSGALYGVRGAIDAGVHAASCARCRG